MSLLSKIAQEVAALSGTTHPVQDPLRLELDPPPKRGRPKPVSRRGVTPESLSMVLRRVDIPEGVRKELKALDDSWVELQGALCRIGNQTPEFLAAEASARFGEALAAGAADAVAPAFGVDGAQERKDATIAGYKHAQRTLAERALELSRPILAEGADAAWDLIREEADAERARLSRWGIPFSPAAHEPLLILVAVADGFRARAESRALPGSRPRDIFGGLIE